MYWASDPKHPVLKRSGMPLYYAEYQFHRDRLIRFRFGFGHDDVSRPWKP
jgi:hypothetical protein